MQKIETGISELLKRQPVTEQEKDAYIQDLQKAMRLLLEEVRDLEEMVALLQKKRFGSSSEATPVQEEEEPLGVFPEAELEYKEDAPEPFKKDQRGPAAMRRKIGSSTWTKKSGSVRGAKENWFGSGKSWCGKSLNTGGPN